MGDNRKEQIILATLKLASKMGLRGISMSMIASEVDIKKPSLYNHFVSKEQLVEEMYSFLRDKAKEKTNTNINLSNFDFGNATASQILMQMVQNYILLTSEENMQMFYRVIYSERAFSGSASSIFYAETEKMINATTQIFEVLKDRSLLQFIDVKLSAISFAMTIHGLMEHLLDKNESDNLNVLDENNIINKYIANFCAEHCVRGKYEEKID